MSQICQIDSIIPIVFHYNKAHNLNQEIPPWVIKAKGETYYVNHIDVEKNVGFSSRETPDNASTKAALKFKGKLTINNINDQIIATIFI